MAAIATVAAAVMTILVNNGQVSGEGVLIQGVECPRVRMTDGREFSLMGGDIRKLRSATGQRVRVIGEIVAVSTCMQGLTLRVETINLLDTDSN